MTKARGTSARLGAAYRAAVLDSTLDALRTAARGSTDAGGYFPAMYSRVTRRVMDDAQAGRFVDNERMARFVVGFADRYLDASAEPATAAKCWRGAFDVAGDPSLLIIQHLLIGINAHVNFDLPQAVVRLVDDGAELAAIRPDFDAVNDILAATYDDLLGDLDRVTRWTGKAAASGGGRIFNFSLRAARGSGLARGRAPQCGGRSNAPHRRRPSRRVGCRARVPRDASNTTRAVARPAAAAPRDTGCRER